MFTDPIFYLFMAAGGLVLSNFILMIRVNKLEKSIKEAICQAKKSQ